MRLKVDFGRSALRLVMSTYRYRVGDNVFIRDAFTKLTCSAYRVLIVRRYRLGDRNMYVVNHRLSNYRVSDYSVVIAEEYLDPLPHAYNVSNHDRKRWMSKRTRLQRAAELEGVDV